MSNQLSLRPVPLSSSRGTVELGSLSSPHHHAASSPPNDTSICSCLGSCWKVISWTFSIIAYIIELFVYVWVAYIYATSTFPQKYYLFGLSLGYLVLPTVFIATISLVWYYNLDRFHRRRRERDPHNLEFIEYRKKFTVWSLILHILLLGVVYRYSQLIYLTLIGKRNNLPYLHRDTILVRFFHAFLSSAPHIVIHAYASVIALTSESPVTNLDPLSPAVLSALGMSIVSVVYTILSFATNDRVSGKARRVVLPAHLTQILWHLCMIVSRVVALVAFAYIYEYYVAAVVVAHWVLMVFILLLQRTTFCADIERQSNGDLKFTRRLCLEIPFDLIAAAVYVFVYFNPKRGRTRVWAGVFHVVMLTENVTMAVLFFLSTDNSPLEDVHSRLPLIVLVTVVALYPVGLVLMFCYYLLYHPKRTGNCFWIGCHRRCWCGSKLEQVEEGPVIGTKYQQRNSRVIISEPTLVSHNGYVPKNLLPVGPNAVNPANQNETQLTSHSQSLSIPNGRISRDRSLTETEGRRANGHDITTSTPGGRQGRDQNGVLVLSPVRSLDSSHTNTARTASESIPVFSDFPASELDTGSSNAVEANDTVIDTPLFGSTPEATMLPGAGLMRTRLISQDMDSQKTCTNDTGIDVDSDLQLTPGTLGGDLEDMISGLNAEAGGNEGNNGIIRLPVFVDVPAKRGDYRSGLEQHYFPSEEEDGKRRADQPRGAPQDIVLHPRGSVTPTLPTPTYTPSPTALTPNSTRAQWRHHSSEEFEEVFHGDGSPQQRPRRGKTTPPSSPERPRKAPRSPIGARSHQVSVIDGEPSLSQQSTHSEQGAGSRAVTPRSPKGARRLLVQQPGTAPPTSSAQEKPMRRHAPPPPRPPRTSSIPNGDKLVQSVPTPVATSSAEATEAFQPSPRQPQPLHQPLHQPQPLHPQHQPAQTQAQPPFKPIAKAPGAPSDGLTRGLSSLVPPMAGSERRAQSSSPLTRQKVTPQTTIPAGPRYSRSSSHNIPHMATDSPARVHRGATSNYKRVSALEGHVMGGSAHSMQYYHAQPRPKSDGWRVDASTAPNGQHGRGGYRQVLLNSHGSSPERTPYNSTSSDHRFHSVSSANSIDGQNRLSRTRYEDAQRRRNYSHSNPAMPKSTGYYSTNIPRSAFNRVSPERHRAQHVGVAAGRGLQQPQSYPITNGDSPSRSPRRYPKAPQGALANAPKMIRSPPGRRNIPPALPPSQVEPSIDEPLTDMNSSSHTHSLGTHSMGSMSSAANRNSGTYDKLPLDIGEGLTKTPVMGRPGNRGSFLGSLHPPQSSTHESVV